MVAVLYWASALKSRAQSRYSHIIAILIVENDVRSPDSVEGKPNGSNIAKIRVVPGKVGVIPLLAAESYVQLTDIVSAVTALSIPE